MPQFTTHSDNPYTPEQTFAYIIDLTKWSSFPGYGPLPGIVEASVPDGTTLALGARVRVKNTDGSVHHEVVTAFEPGRHYAVRMELSPPASYLMSAILENVWIEPTQSGTHIRRHFETVPRSFLTAPLVWLLTHLLLKRAVIAHDQAVATSRIST